METEGALLSTVINCIKGRLIKANLLQWLSGYIGVSALPDALWFREHVLAVVRFKYSYSSPTLWGITRSYPLSQLLIISLHFHYYSHLCLFPHTHLWFPAQFVAAGWGGVIEQEPVETCGVCLRQFVEHAAHFSGVPAWLWWKKCAQWSWVIMLSCLWETLNAWAASTSSVFCLSRRCHRQYGG